MSQLAIVATLLENYWDRKYCCCYTIIDLECWRLRLVLLQCAIDDIFDCPDHLGEGCIYSFWQCRVAEKTFTRHFKLLLPNNYAIGISLSACFFVYFDPFLHWAATQGV